MANITLNISPIHKTDKSITFERDNGDILKLPNNFFISSHSQGVQHEIITGLTRSIILPNERMEPLTVTISGKLFADKTNPVRDAASKLSGFLHSPVVYLVSENRLLRVRLQNADVIPVNWQVLDLSLSFIAEDPFYYARTQKSQALGSSVQINNQGTAFALPNFLISATGNFSLGNTTTGEAFNYQGGAGAISINMSTYRVTKNNVDALDTMNNDFFWGFRLEPGINALTLTGATGTIYFHERWY